MAFKRKVKTDAKALLDALETMGIAKEEWEAFLKQKDRVEKIEGISLEDAVIRYGKSISKLSKETIRAYMYTIQAFVRSVEKSVGKSASQIMTTELIPMHFYDFLSDRTWNWNHLKKIREERNDDIANDSFSTKEIITSLRTYNMKARRLNGLIKFLRKNRFVDRDFDPGLKKMRDSGNIPESLNLDEIKRVMELAQKSRHNIRDKAIVYLMVSTGMRVSEVANAEIDNINWDDKTLDFIAKGNKPMTVCLVDATIEAIRDYLCFRGYFGCPQSFQAEVGHEKYLFLNHEGKNAGKKIRPYSIKDRLETLYGKMFDEGYLINREQLKGLTPKEYNEKRKEIVKKYGAHTIRHSFGHGLLDAGASIAEVRDAMGHANIATTNLYLQIKKDDVIREVRRKSPFANIKPEDAWNQEIRNKEKGGD